METVQYTTNNQNINRQTTNQSHNIRLYVHYTQHDKATQMTRAAINKPHLLFNNRPQRYQFITSSMKAILYFIAVRLTLNLRCYLRIDYENPSFKAKSSLTRNIEVEFSLGGSLDMGCFQE